MFIKMSKNCDKDDITEHVYNTSGQRILTKGRIARRVAIED